MTTHHRSVHHCSVRLATRLRRVMLGVFCSVMVLSVSSLVAAGDPGYYSGGVFRPLIVSESEFVVEFADPADRPAFAKRLRASMGVALEDVPWGKSGRLAILRVSDGGSDARLRARGVALPSSGGQVRINRVYRAKLGALPILSTGNIVVRFRSDMNDTELSQILNDYRLERVKPVAGLAHTYVVRMVDGVADAELDTANALYRDDRTVYAHPDLRFPLATRQAFDTFFNQQWHLDNTGQNGATAEEDISIFGAYARALGATIIVGQVDDACDVQHEDYAANYLGISHDITDNSQSATAANPKVEGDRHGTATMGLMVADVNGLGVVGVAPRAQFTASRGLSDTVSTSQIASAYSFARNLDVDVHNNSWGFDAGTSNPDVIVDAIETAFTEGRDGLGMVICFASGNGSGMNEGDPAGVEVMTGEELATLDTVIGVGASNAAGELASYSNFGKEIDVLAPSNDFPSGTETLPAIVTTDNRDGVFSNSDNSIYYNGYNNAGFDDDGGVNLADSNYTSNFGGTSAAAPQVAGLAALILSLEPTYTAVTVRNIIEHTCDQINPDVASYNNITSRSLRYGYGRINAGTAVEATFDGFFWPERVANVKVENNTIFWTINDDIRKIGVETFGVVTGTVLVVKSDSPITDWKPVDGQVYSTGDVVSPDVTVVANLKAEQYSFGVASGTQYFGVFSVATTQRRGNTYGFGVSVTSAGEVIDSGVAPEDGSGGTLPPSKPRVSIEVKPLSGVSPLEVSFVGNAQSENDIPDGGFVWDFDDGVTSTNRVTTHIYTVSSGERKFNAKLTVTDSEGLTGSRSVQITVTAPDTGGGNEGETGGSVTIRISDPDSLTSDISSGTVPLPVVLTAELVGSLGDSGDLTVFWDLGDGNTETSLSVAHTYQIAGTFPISVTISSSSLAAPLQATRFLQVLADTTEPTPTPSPTPESGTGGSTPCGATPVAAFFVMGLFVMLRKLTR